jgi:hypothetical protein
MEKKARRESFLGSVAKKKADLVQYGKTSERET